MVYSLQKIRITIYMHTDFRWRKNRFLMMI
nr:MAG TPA: hypothetical protein [Caudoviricetes sp.]DAX50596.1 MAG TPA: hypothetical protein [Caudoviricetes sp.]